MTSTEISPRRAIWRLLTFRLSAGEFNRLGTRHAVLFLLTMLAMVSFPVLALLYSAAIWHARSSRRESREQG
jgi:hypothetical protein